MVIYAGDHLSKRESRSEVCENVELPRSFLYQVLGDSEGKFTKRSCSNSRMQVNELLALPKLSTPKLRF